MIYIYISYWFSKSNLQTCKVIRWTFILSPRKPFYSCSSSDLCSVAPWAHPDRVSVRVTPSIGCLLVNTRSLHPHSIRRGSLTAHWGNDDRAKWTSAGARVFGAVVCRGIKHAISVVRTLIGPQCQDAVLASLPGHRVKSWLSGGGSLRFLFLGAFR